MRAKGPIMCIANDSKTILRSVVVSSAFLPAIVSLAMGCAVTTSADDGSLASSAAVTSSVSGVTFKTQMTGNFIGAQNNGGGAVIATATVAQAWETFTLIDQNGGTLMNGDSVFIKTGGGEFFQALNGGGSTLNAASLNELGWETFRVVKASGAGAIATGDVVGLQAVTNGTWVSAQNGGGGPVFAYGGALGAWEKLVIGLGTTSGGGGGAPDAGTVDSGSGGGGNPGGLRVVAYLPNYSGSYADWAKRIDFNKMTHLNLAFATANGSNGWDMGASDGDVKALVDAAHSHGVKVLASLGGGGGDQSVIARYKTASNIDPLVANLDTFLKNHNLDGADIDIEDGGNLGAAYSSFVGKIVAKIRPEGKLVTAAVAQYLQGSMADSTLHSFDFINVMIYSSYSESVNQLNYYANNKGVAKSQITLGAGFFGSDNSGNEYSYSDILAADGNAWSKDQATVRGQTVNYTGMASMKRLADYSKGYGGIMFWELSEDTTDSHSLYKVIQGEF